MKNKWRILKILVTVILFGFLLSFSLKRFNNKSLESVSVNMKQKTPVYFIDEKDIKEIVKKENPNKRIGDINIPELERKLNLLPAVDSANVYLNLNGNLNLDITQRVPIFRLNKNGNNFYVDEKGREFPISKNYSHPCMLVTGDVKKSEYKALAELIKKIDEDDFSKKFFIGISKEGRNYNLFTNEAHYKVELGSLENIDFKIKGFKTFAEKFLVYQDPMKYEKISVKYDNQIVTTLSDGYHPEEDSLAKHKPVNSITATAEVPKPSSEKIKKKEVAPTSTKTQAEIKQKINKIKI